MEYFTLKQLSKKSGARVGELATAHGVVPTPFFMPVATQAAAKHITTEEIKQLGAKIILSNTYHLFLRPNEAKIKKLGGLHQFMAWSGAILTDSGGFQVFSLAGKTNRGGKSLVKILADGVTFTSHIDGKKHHFTPELVWRIQRDLGVDIAVCLDVCPALPAGETELKRSVELTSDWAKRTIVYHRKQRGYKPRLHCVVQGGASQTWREQSLADLAKLDFDGYNIGGLAVGEDTETRNTILSNVVPLLPTNKPRYLMGVGYPEQIVSAVKQGVDMFDCVIPTREGRHGRLFIWQTGQKAAKLDDKGSFYKTINILNSEFSSDKKPINVESKLPILRQYSRAYLHHLYKINEPLGQRLASLNNVEFYLELMHRLRQMIIAGKL
ncbi:MAG: tRNA guanosine(34) transglycosylase Tgt [Candidatus Falkowbacteria bacterium]